MNLKDSVVNIMVMVSDMMTVYSTERFSRLYFIMTASDVRHCLVLDPNTKKCLRIISKRDLVQQIPPANLISDEEFHKIGLVKSEMNTELRHIAAKSLQDVFPLDQPLLTVCEENTIEDVIHILTHRHSLGGERYYISGIPVLSRNKEELKGFVSYIDVLRFIRDNETDFLRETHVREASTIIQTKGNVDKAEIIYLTPEDDLAMAAIQMKGIRSLPVIDNVDDRKWIGFVDDLKVKMFSHRLFINELSQLTVENFMIPANYLPSINPNQPLKDVINYFLKGSNGMELSSTFVITEKYTTADERGKEISYQRVQGMISYIDILKAWLDWKILNSSKSSSQSTQKKSANTTT
jgi:CBS domain-containing protein